MSLLEIWEARSISSEAFSTAVIACVGSVAWPVASCSAAVVADVCVCSNELIAFVSALPKLPPESAVGVTLVPVVASAPSPPTEPTLHSLGPSGPTAPEIAGII